MISLKYNSDYRYEDVMVGNKLREVAVYVGPLFYVKGINKKEGKKPVWTVAYVVLLWLFFFVGLISKSNLSHFVVSILSYALAAIGIYKLTIFSYAAMTASKEEKFTRKLKDTLENDSKTGAALVLAFSSLALVASVVYSVVGQVIFLFGDYLFLMALLFMVIISLCCFIRTRKITAEEVVSEEPENNNDITQ